MRWQADILRNGTHLQDGSRPLEGSFQTLLHLLSKSGSTKKLRIALKALYDLTRHPTSAVSSLLLSQLVARLAKLLSQSDSCRLFMNREIADYSIFGLTCVIIMP